jgi:hypothetical protein
MTVPQMKNPRVYEDDDGWTLDQFYTGGQRQVRRIRHNCEKRANWWGGRFGVKKPVDQISFKCLNCDEEVPENLVTAYCLLRM